MKPLRLNRTMIARLCNSSHGINAKQLLRCWGSKASVIIAFDNGENVCVGSTDYFVEQKKRVESNFWKKVKKTESGCWEWTGRINVDGYGKFEYESLGVRIYYGAHAWAYKHCKGDCPKGFDVDHLCRNTKCVNPDHLEAVRHRENVIRGNSPSAINARKTHCIRGHLLEGYNVIARSGGMRWCRICRNESKLKRQHAAVRAGSEVAK